MNEEETIIPKLYGTSWCEKTGYLKSYFSINEIPFEYYNMEENEEAAQVVRDANGGKLKFPLVIIGEFKLMTPSIHEVEKRLIYYRLLEEF